MSAWVILSRPAHRNAELAQRIKADGLGVVCLPALQLLPLVTTVQQMVWPDDFDLVIFVSGHAAQAYLDNLTTLRPRAIWPDQVRVATVGYSSARPLYMSDIVSDHLIMHPEPGTLGQDSEGLWSVLQSVLPEIKNVLIVRGQSGREWLGQQFEKAGINVTRLSLYRREPVVWQTEQVEQLKLAFRSDVAPVFLLTSSESVDAVYANMKRLDMMQQWAGCQFVVIHERISTRLQTILQALGRYASHPIKVCAPCDDAIYQAIRSSASQSGRL